MSYSINLHDNLEKQIKLINFNINNIEVIVSKVDSFYPLIKLIKEQDKCQDCIITVICFPYEGINKLTLSNNFKYCFTIVNQNVMVSIDDINIDCTTTSINDYNCEKPNSFIIDLFQLYPHIKYYNQCNIKYSNDVYIEYIRHHHNIIEIRTAPGYSGYSGGVSYYDININSFVYNSCTCFEDVNFLENYLNPNHLTILSSENLHNINFNDTKCLNCSSILNNFYECDNNCGTIWCDKCQNDMHFIIEDNRYIITKGHICSCDYA